MKLEFVGKNLIFKSIKSSVNNSFIINIDNIDNVTLVKEHNNVHDLTNIVITTKAGKECKITRTDTKDPQTLSDVQTMYELITGWYNAHLSKHGLITIDTKDSDINQKNNEVMVPVYDTSINGYRAVPESKASNYSRQLSYGGLGGHLKQDVGSSGGNVVPTFQIGGYIIYLERKPYFKLKQGGSIYDFVSNFTNTNSEHNKLVKMILEVNKLTFEDCKKLTCNDKLLLPHFFTVIFSKIK